ncbi:hypothetical protein [Streptomyces sp. NPDC006134]|uniref:hypothetical protein n=1 Tax=Streptomyces sp. NPDC006134 TaxID=3154467 RepID=UPI0033D264BE
MSEGHDARHVARDRREPEETFGPPGPTASPGQEPKQPHAGNGTVKHGPDEQGPDTPGPDGLASGGPASGGPASGGPGEPVSGGLVADELALRRLLHQAVRDVEPRDGTLEYLRQAVPARRARKRQAVVGMAAAALFIGTAIPALVHVTGSTGDGANPSVAGHASQAQGGTGEGKDPAGGRSATGGSSQRAEGKETAGPQEKEETEKPGSGTEGTTGGAGPSASADADTPLCAADQLGSATASSGAPDSTGTVYGSFRVTNVSSAGCTVGGPGSVSVAPQGAADPARIGTARHVAGDAAAGLPDPSLEAAQLALAPGASYEVRFAWVPSETCPTTGGDTGGSTGGPSPDPTPTEDASETAGTTTGGGETGATTQLLTEDGTADGSVAVTYTAETGAASATATVTGACAGTVYWTGVLAES